MKNNTLEITNNLHTFTSLIGQMTISARVYRDSYKTTYDTTNNGISSNQDTLLILHADGNIPITKDNLHQVVSVNKGLYFNIYVTPICRNPFNSKGIRKDVGPCAGGNFLYSSDSRFSSISKQPIAIHDRWDTQEDYNALTT